MIWLLGLAMLLDTGTAADGPKAQVRAMDDETTGNVTMNEQRQLFIYYDDHPDGAVGSFPGEPGYSLYLELAPGIEPGQRKRLAKAVAMFERRADGTYSVSRYAKGEGGAAEPRLELVHPAGREHRCYEQVLADRATPGQHYLLLSEWRAICSCLERLPDA
jgi:hypothetical protein